MQEEFAETVDKAVLLLLEAHFPCLAAKVIFSEIETVEFRTYAAKVENAGSFCLMHKKGNDNSHRRNRQPSVSHRCKELQPFRQAGRECLRECGITQQKCTSYDTNGPWYTSGLRG